MAITNIRADFKCDIMTVWNKVTSLEDYKWRSDIREIKVIEENQTFIEYTNTGYPTQFTITVFEPYQRYEFDMDNENMEGHWIGVFSESQGVVTIDFTEIVTAKKFYMKPFVKIYLKKQQTLYIEDLKKALNQI